MTMLDLFSKRQKKLRGEIPDVYQYDLIPAELKVQIIHIWNDAIGNIDDYNNVHDKKPHNAYKHIVESLCREYGKFVLRKPGAYGRNYYSEFCEYFISEENIDKQIDAIELSFRLINGFVRENYRRPFNENIVENSIYELNARFKEHGVGYEFNENNIIRIDSELIHSEVVKPALKLLHNKDYLGAQDEFLSAYNNYKAGKNKAALNDCLKSFESTMKVICDKHNWTYPPNATSNALIKLCFDNNLIPTFWEQKFTALRSLLESSISTGRNKLSGHGQGSTPLSVPDYIVSYMLHMTATTIVFLVNAENEYK